MHSCMHTHIQTCACHIHKWAHMMCMHVLAYVAALKTHADIRTLHLCAYVYHTWKCTYIWDYVCVWERCTHAMGLLLCQAHEHSGLPENVVCTSMRTYIHTFHVWLMKRRTVTQTYKYGHKGTHTHTHTLSLTIDRQTDRDTGTRIEA
jgi:hypothetical protein